MSAADPAGLSREGWVLPRETSPDIARLIGDQPHPVAALPIGSFEQHGPHLPLATDTIVATMIVHRLSLDHRLVPLPAITISCSHEHASFPGTVSISARTLHAVVADIRDSLQRQGIPRLVLVNGHGGNYVLSNVVQEATVDGPHVTLFPGRTDWQRARAEAGLQSDPSVDMHGGELEVSLLLHADPSLVGDGYRADDHVVDERPFLLVHGMAAYTETGVMGLPSLGTAEKGRAVLDSLSRSFADHLQQLR